jgi:DNA (cytosine-5)-methyltransferase 1
VLDAQNFGVAQRRRRVFVVGCLGNWESAAKVLFESESLSGDIKQNKKTRKNITKYPPDCVGTLLARDYKGLGSFDHDKMIVHAVFCDTYNGTIQGNIAATMTADMAGPTHSGPKVMENMAVRRLTPVECERLQGFPDNYTNIPKAADGHRYKALGNSMAVPVMRWIGERINNYERL